MYIFSDLIDPKERTIESLYNQNIYIMYPQGIDFQSYESELAKQLGFDATDDWSNSDGNVTLILAFEVIYYYVIKEKKYLVILPLFKW